MGSKRKHKPVKWTDEVLEQLRRRFRSYMLCGQFGVRFEEWDAMPPEARGAMEKAARELRVEFVVMLATALRSNAGLLKVASEIDGGESLVEFTLSEAVASYMARRGTRA